MNPISGKVLISIPLQISKYQGFSEGTDLDPCPEMG